MDEKKKRIGVDTHLFELSPTNLKWGENVDNYTIPCIASILWVIDPKLV